MITIEHTGRLANYMFQVASTFGIAYKLGEKAEFEIYPNSCEFFKHYQEIDKSWFPDLKLPLRSKEYENVYIETHAGYQEIDYMPNMCLKGYFQSFKYFEHIKEYLINCVFKVPESIQADTIAIHVRRQDYLAYPKIYPILPLQYYFNAISLVGKNKKLLFFSDDIEYCKFHFSSLQDSFFSEGQNPYSDIMLLASCEHIITSNSTFSLMAALLSRNDNKTVICPCSNQWYMPDIKHNTDDLIPNSFIQLKY